MAFDLESVDISEFLPKEKIEEKSEILGKRGEPHQQNLEENLEPDVGKRLKL